MALQCGTVQSLKDTKKCYRHVYGVPELLKEYLDKINEGIKELDPEFIKEKKEQLFQMVVNNFSRKGTVKAFSGYTLVFMSDHINSNTEGVNRGATAEYAVRIPGFKVHDFVQWLVENKHGIVTGSPVTASQYHQSGKGNFSVNQGWIWIPPGFEPLTIPDTAFVSNLESLGTEEEYFQTLRTKLDMGVPEIRKTLFKNSVFFNKAIEA